MMGRRGRVLVLLAAIMLGSLRAACASEVPPKDPPDAQDYPLLSRMAGARIIAYDQASDEEATLPEARFVDFDFIKRRTIEGRVTRIAYVFADGQAGRDGADGLSTITVMNHYLDALKGAGFSLAFQCVGEEGCGGFSFGERLTQPMAETHAGDEGNLIIDFLHPVGNDIRYVLATLSRPQGVTTVALAVARSSGRQPGLFIEAVEQPAPSSEDVPVSATWIEAALKARGSVPLYSILFDDGTAKIKRKSRPVLEQIARMLQSNPTEKLLVVGHTDMSQPIGVGMALSSARAIAVMQMLVRKCNVPQEQISAIGVGPAAPVASNADEVGRARNQRIELVLQQIN